MVIYLKPFRKPALIFLSAVLFIAAAVLVNYYLPGHEREDVEVYADAETAEAFLAAIGCFGRDSGSAEIFDIEKGSVVQTYKMQPEERDAAVTVLGSINGMVVKAKAFPDSGYIAKIPFEPVVEAKSKWLKDYSISYVAEVFIIFPGDKAPYLLVLDKNQHPLFFTFKEEGQNKLLNKLQAIFEQLKKDEGRGAGGPQG